MQPGCTCQLLPASRPCSMRGGAPNVRGPRGEEVVAVEVEHHDEAKGGLPGQAKGGDQADHLRSVRSMGRGHAGQGCACSARPGRAGPSAGCESRSSPQGQGTVRWCRRPHQKVSSAGRGCLGTWGRRASTGACASGWERLEELHVLVPARHPAPQAGGTLLENQEMKPNLLRKEAMPMRAANQVSVSHAWPLPAQHTGLVGAAVDGGLC